jgi:hypothetical protein
LGFLLHLWWVLWAYLSEMLGPLFLGVISNDKPGEMGRGGDGGLVNVLIGGPQPGVV